MALAKCAVPRVASRTSRNGTGGPTACRAVPIPAGDAGANARGHMKDTLHFGTAFSPILLNRTLRKGPSRCGETHADESKELRRSPTLMRERSRNDHRM